VLQAITYAVLQPSHLLQAPVCVLAALRRWFSAGRLSLGPVPPSPMSALMSLRMHAGNLLELVGVRRFPPPPPTPSQERLSMRRLLQGSAPPPPFQSAFSGLSHHFGVWWPVCSSRSSSRASRDTCSAWRPHGGRRARSLRSTHEGGLVQIARRASTRTCSRQWISQGPQSRSRSLPFVGSDRPPPSPCRGRRHVLVYVLLHEGPTFLASPWPPCRLAEPPLASPSDRGSRRPPSAAAPAGRPSLLGCLPRSS
jgi:hypothetical protein